ncbi:PIR Superfamily Protein, partial [Plasmodium malariae]
YNFLENKPPYEFTNFGGYHEKSYYENLCSDLSKNSSYYEKKNCIDLFSIMDNVIEGDVLDDDPQSIWNNFKEWFPQNKSGIDFSSVAMRDLITKFGEFIKANISKKFDEFKVSYMSNVELSDLTKLYYFTKNVGNIDKKILDVDSSDRNKYCNFINECLQIYRIYKYTTCEGNSPRQFDGNPICMEADNFFESYKNILYDDLKSLGMVTSEQASIDDLVKCSRNDYTYLYNYVFGIRKLSGFDNTRIVLLTMFGIFLIMFILYKFTPLGSLVQPRKRKTRKLWRNIQKQIHEQVNEGNTDFADSYLSIPSVSSSNYMESR